VKELHEAATAWQQEISKLTQLDLRGRKRRKTSEASASSNRTEVTSTEIEADESNQIDTKKVAELSNDPILWKVRYRWSPAKIDSSVLLTLHYIL